MKNELVKVCSVTGLLGFFIGVFLCPSRHNAVECAQVLAGVVDYPVTNSYYIYQIKSWTLYHQICALFLYLGVSERTLSFAVSGVLGMLSYQGLSLVVYAFSRKAFLSIVAPLLIHLGQTANFGPSYRVIPVGSFSSYGSLGLSVVLLAVGLIGNGISRLGGLLLGMSPSIHLLLGFYCWIVAAAGFLMGPHEDRNNFKNILNPFCIGVALCLISFVTHVLVARDIGTVSVEEAARYFDVYLSKWAAHQYPVDWKSPGFWLNQAATVISLLWLRLFSGDLNKSSIFILRAFVASGVLSLLSAALTWVPPAMVPKALLLAMPGRFLNFNILGLPALLIGLLGRYSTVAACGCLATLVVPMFLVMYGRFAQGRIAALIMIAVTAMALFFMKLLQNVNSGLTSQLNPQSRNEAARIWGVLLGVMLGLVLQFVIGGGYRNSSFSNLCTCLPDISGDRFRKEDGDFWAILAGRKGTLLVSDIYLVQSRTGRPILLSPVIDQLHYAPGSGAEMNRVMREVYGVDLFAPPWNTPVGGHLPSRLYRCLWQRRSPGEWMKIRNRFGVTDVVTRRGWVLQLPEIAHNDGFTAYSIPEDGFDRIHEGNRGPKIEALNFNKLPATFLFNEGRSEQWLCYGWSNTEPWGTWTEGPSALLIFPLENSPESDIAMIADAVAFVTDSHPEIKADIYVNDTPIGSWTFRHKEPKSEARVLIPKSLLSQRDTLNICFRINNPVSPHSLGLSTDGRLLGIGLKRLTFEKISGSVCQ